MDSDICAAVQKELVTDPRIDADDIVVVVFNGEVSLDGTVPSQTQCSEAVAAARRGGWRDRGAQSLGYRTAVPRLWG